MKTTCLLLTCLVVSSLLRPPPVSGQTLSFSALTPSGNQLTIEVNNNGNSNSFLLQGTSSLRSSSWAPVTATFSPVAGRTGFFKATIPLPAGGRFFYRVIGLAGTAQDTDGDGLANAFETTLGTNPNLFDTDGDGFSDGAEFVGGTDLLSATSFPRFADLPIVRFAEATTVVEEGSGVVPLSMVSEQGAYSGTVTVEVSTIGSAVAGTDFTVPLTVGMSNGVASLPLTLIDNLTLSQVYRILILQVRSATGQYTIGGGFRTTIVIGDNDAYWNGMLGDGDEQQNFRLRILRQGGTSQVAFVSGGANDGLPRGTQAGTSDQSSGLIPIGTHAATITANSSTAFDITSPPLPVGSQATLFGSGLTLNRVLRLQSGPSIAESSVSPTLIYGTFTENTSAPGGTAPHLTVAKSGNFALVRDVPAPPTLTGVAP